MDTHIDVDILGGTDKKGDSLMMSMGMDGTKWQIFNAAIDMFADSSYHLVSMRDIARRVGIKASSIYNHFLSKEELLNTIFEYYLYYMEYHAPKLDQLLETVGNKPPDVVLREAVVMYDVDIRERMGKIVLIACKEMHSASVAEELLYDSLIRMPTKVVGALLDRMVELGSLEPMDTETFLLLYTSLCHTCALRQHTSHPVGMDEWLRGLEMIYKTLPLAEAFKTPASHTS